MNGGSINVSVSISTSTISGNARRHAASVHADRALLGGRAAVARKGRGRERIHRRRRLSTASQGRRMKGTFRNLLNVTRFFLFFAFLTSNVPNEGVVPLPFEMIVYDFVDVLKHRNCSRQHTKMGWTYNRRQNKHLVAHLRTGRVAPSRSQRCM